MASKEGTWQDTSRLGEDSSSQRRGVERHRQEGTRFQQLTATAQVEAEVQRVQRGVYEHLSRDEIIANFLLYKPQLRDQYELEQYHLKQQKLDEANREVTPDRRWTIDDSSLPSRESEKVPSTKKRASTWDQWLESPLSKEDLTSPLKTVEMLPRSLLSSPRMSSDLGLLSPLKTVEMLPRSLLSSPGMSSDLGPPSPSNSRDVSHRLDAPQDKGPNKWEYSSKIGTLQQVKHIRKRDLDSVTQFCSKGVQKVLIDLKRIVSARPNNAPPEDQISNDESFIKEWDQCAQNGSEELKKVMRDIIYYVSAREGD